MVSVLASSDWVRVPIGSNQRLRSAMYTPMVGHVLRSVMYPPKVGHVLRSVMYTPSIGVSKQQIKISLNLSRRV
jgi:hypothetical protein